MKNEKHPIGCVIDCSALSADDLNRETHTMSRPAINSIKLNDHLTLSECHPDSECRTNNWWLYDNRACGGMNIGMREKTRDEAFVAAIEFWAKRAAAAEKAYAQIKGQVDAFVNHFVEHEDADD